MPIPFGGNSLRFKFALIFAGLLSLTILAVLGFPTGSRAKREVPEQTPVQRSSKQPGKRFVPGELLVRYKSESIAAHKTGSARLTAKNGDLLTMRVEDIGVSSLVEGLRLARVAPDDTFKTLEALRSQPEVMYAELNYIVRATRTPNDTRFASQTNMLSIGAPAAWDTQTGSPGVVVAILDQGIDMAHVDLAANKWINPSPGSFPPITGDVNGYNFVNNNGVIFSGANSENHATHVAGIVGAVGDNNTGVAGVAWSVRLMSLKFLDEEGSGDTADAIRACTYVKQMRDLWVSSGQTSGANVRVVNASFSGAQFSQAFVNALNGLNTSGVLFVAAAGNSTEDGSRDPDNDRVPHYPANFNVPNVISVAATDNTDQLATSFSHFGAATVDLAAPGASILSTTPKCTDPGPPPDFPCQPTPPNIGDNSTYSTFSGTSMSAPHVSGAAALLWSQNPNLTVQQVKNLLILDGDVLPALSDKTLTSRRLNIANSLQSLAQNDVTAPGAATNFHINSQVGRTFNVGWTSSGDDGANGTASLYQISFVDGSTVIPLKGAVPLPSGKGQIATVSVPFRRLSGQLRLQVFDNAGNEGPPVNIPVSIPLSEADPFTSNVGPAVGLTTGGTNLNPNADDAYLDFVLPGTFSFPFLGQNLTSVFLSTNGSIYFGNTPPIRPIDSTADDVPSAPGKVGGYQMIAGLWDDLDLRIAQRATAGIYVVQPTSNRLIFRWQGVPCNYNGSICVGGGDVNFEIELQTNGVIKTRYGTGNVDLFPTVGLGAGAQDGYVIASHTSEDVLKSLTNAGEVTFTPRTLTTSSVQFSQPTFSVSEGTNSLAVGVTRTGDTTSVATVGYATTDGAGAAACNSGGGNASSRCDYLTTIGRLTFASGENSKTLQIPIVDDNYVEGPQTFSIALSSPVGVSLGAQSTATLTINDGGVEGGSNPIDQAAFFVRQHYIDFLNREADPGGLNFWTNEITSCGSNPACIDVKRVNVSAAFFLSIEFQQTGYLVYRIYKSGLGNMPGAPVPVAFGDFLRDTQQIGLGVQVGSPDWEVILESNKQAYALEFVQRPAFVAAYPSSLTAQQFVDQLNLNAGNPLSPAEKSSLVSFMGSSAADLSRRASVLRSVAEDSDLQNAETNKAFVLMQYFGYMRRSPNDAPDSDFGGFNFWLAKLDSFGGNFVNADMVKSFLVSGEYRNRFGQ
jgi:subtilisin family serine protease